MFENNLGILSGYWSYIVLVLPALAFALWAQFHVKSTFAKYAKVASERNMTGADAARMVLMAGGVTDVPVEHVSGELTDHYDAKAKIIRLSDKVYGSRTASAVGVAAHEAGHAVQYAQGYGPIKLRSAIIPVTNIGSKLSMPLILGGLLLSTLSEGFFELVYIGIICFAMSTLFQLITLPVEFDASRRALEAIEARGILYEEETKGAKKVLRAAAMTYVAALAVSLMQLLRFILLFSGRRR